MADSTDLPIHVWNEIRKAAPSEQEIRRDERRLLGRSLAASITDDELRQLLTALSDPKVKRNAGNLVHLLVTTLEQAAAEDAKAA